MARALRIIVDTNQASALKKNADLACSVLRVATLVLTYDAIFEILLAPHGSQILRSLSMKYTIRFGIEPLIALREVAIGTDAQAVAYQPFYRSNMHVHKLLRRKLKKDPQSLLDDARRIKKSNRDHMRSLTQSIQDIRKRNRDALSRGERIDDICDLKSIDEAMTKFEVPKRHVDQILNGDGSSRKSRVDHDDASRRLMVNPFTRRFLQFLNAVHIGYGDGWADPSLNVSPSPHRDDMPDMLLSLYAKDGDVILTADRQFRRLYKFLDPSMGVKTMSLDELLRWAH